VYYSQGVGSQGGWIDRLYGGITGHGISDIIREAYSFICTNYIFGDEIFLFGFSRGAFVVRKLSDLINEVGVLSKRGLEYMPEIYRDVEHRFDHSYIPDQPNEPFRNKGRVNDRYREELRRKKLTTLGVTIKAISVWETVGSLGVPRISWLEKIGIQSSTSKNMCFSDTKLLPCIENAFQALALDERRAAFRPALWEKLRGSSATLKQVWFPGVHSNVGGGYDDQQLANITLAWIMAQVRNMIDMDLDYLLDEWERTEDYYDATGQKRRPWSFGKIYNSLRGPYTLGGNAVRLPGRYFVVDPCSDRETDTPLHETNEYIHPSVRLRLKKSGPGYDDKGSYVCEALKDWKLMIVNSNVPDSRNHPLSPNNPNDQPKTSIFWELRTRETNVTTRTLPECPLWSLEKELLEQDSNDQLIDYVLRPPVPPPQRPSSMRRRSDGPDRPEDMGRRRSSRGNDFNNGGARLHKDYQPGNPSRSRDRNFPNNNNNNNNNNNSSWDYRRSVDSGVYYNRDRPR